MKNKKYKAATNAPNVGQLLKNHIHKHRLRRGVLAGLLGRSYSTVYNYQESPSMQTHILWELSTALTHNFFMDLAAQLPADFTTNAPDVTLPFQERIAALEEEAKLMNAKMETLVAVMKK
ncbi:MAG: hypothetical protein JJE55_15165 [Flavobacteriaceae bacterium]|nr:hypothetical protein [Flavobacteriaceae bacterium]